VFCRFAGCNLWSGREEDRSRAVCSFCDTDFVGTDGAGGGRFADACALVAAVVALWPARGGGDGEGGAARPRPFVVLTGGEPLLQLDAALIAEFHARGCALAIETNGTIAAPPSLDWNGGSDWLCVSPKAGADWVQRAGSELKLVWPQAGIDLAPLLDLPFRHFFLSPVDGLATSPQSIARNTALCVEHCLRDPRWRLNLQTHKFIGIP
jgi:7-carboxy-7-deazaguanine synthase (Cx14CxxC type)